MRITRVFFDIHMGFGFPGLNKVAEQAKTKLDADSVVIFLNRKTTAFKLMVGGAYLTYYKNGREKIPLEALRLLPTKFGGDQMQFDKAVRESLWKKLQVSQNG